MKSFPPSGQDFMSVSLMTYVPDNPIIRRIKYVVQGDSQFYGSQAGSQMSRVLRQNIDDILTQFRTHFRQLFFGKLVQIGRKMDPVQKMFSHVVSHIALFF